MSWILDNYDFNIDMKNLQGNTLLHIAVLEGRSSCFSLLLNYKPDINAKNDIGQTPLDIAFQLGHMNIQKSYHNIELDGLMVNKL